MIDKVILAEENKLFRFVGQFMRWGGKHYDFAPFEPQTVVIVNSGGMPIGSALVQQQDAVLEAVCCIDYHSSERMEIQGGIRPYFLTPMGYIDVAAPIVAANLDPDLKPMVKRLSLWSLCLDTNPGSPPRPPVEPASLP